MDDKRIINNLIDAWEALPGGRYEGRWGAEKLNQWLSENMAPAVREARNHVGRKPPLGSTTGYEKDN